MNKLHDYIFGNAGLGDVDSSSMTPKACSAGCKMWCRRMGFLEVIPPWE